MSTYRFYTCTHCKAKIGLPASEDHHNEPHQYCRRGDGILVADDVKAHHEIEFHALEAIKHLHALEDRIDELDADLRKEVAEVIASLHARIDTTII
jgi:hypothetical protein